MKQIVTFLAITAGLALAVSTQGTSKKEVPAPWDYGNVSIRQGSSPRGDLPAVVFSHWSHRSKYTCRFCHRDIGFAMKAGTTKISAADNARGHFCGTCHNGATVYNGKTVFAACTPGTTHGQQCSACHRTDGQAGREAAYRSLAQALPREHSGNEINWEKAEEQGLIRLTDSIEGVPVRKPTMKTREDFTLEAKLEGIPDIIFSHKKHTVWIGCDGCHPDIFLGIKKGLTKFTMIDIAAGRYCGICHGTVAFPDTDCRRCHGKLIKL